MTRWLRIASVVAAVAAMIGLGAIAGLVVTANPHWVVVYVPPWLAFVLGDVDLEIWLPALLGGWLVGFLGAVGALLVALLYLWRRRQYEKLIARLERELAALRNLPLTQPAPLEDVAEAPDRRVAAQLAESEDGDPGSSDAW